MSLGSNGVERVRSLRKIPTSLRDTNFFTSSARFASSFVSQLNGPKCTKTFFRVQWGGSGAFVAKNSDATSWHELLHHYDRFAPSFVTQPNGSQCSKIVRNTPKHDRVQWGGSGAFVAKIFEATSWHKLLHQFSPFCNEFRNSTKLSQMHQNCTKRSET